MFREVSVGEKLTTSNQSEGFLFFLWEKHEA